MLSVAPHCFAVTRTGILFTGSEACQTLPGSIESGHDDRWLVSGRHSSGSDSSNDNTPCSSAHPSAVSLSPVLTDGDPPRSLTRLPSGLLSVW